MVVGGVFKGHDIYVNHMQSLHDEAFNDGYEVGRFDELNYQADLKSEECFKVSKNDYVNVLLKRYFKDCKTVHTIYAIAQAESGGKQFAVNVNHNFSQDGGFLQINSIHRNKGESVEDFITRMHDLEQNIALAKIVYDKQGFNAWTQYKNGAYLKYLK